MSTSFRKSTGEPAQVELGPDGSVPTSGGGASGDPQEALLLECRALRLGLEQLLDLEPGTLLQAARDTETEG